MTKEIRDKIAKYGSQLDIFIEKQEYEKLKLLLDEMEQYASTEKEIKNDALFNYFLGTGYGTYSDSIICSGKAPIDTAVVEMRRKSMFYLREAIKNAIPDDHIDSRIKFRILTNYANELDNAGRVFEALRIYREVLKENEKFSMALGNYGRALQFLANIVNDGGHYNELHCYAYQAIKRALSIEDLDMYEQAKDAFQKIVDEYEKLPTKSILAEKIVFKKYPLGEGDEKAYREWCLRNHLFLNPLNDVIEIESAFAHDPLTITSFSEDIHYSDSVSGNPAEPPRWFAMLNQLKEEYVYARFLCYEGSEKYHDVHYADKEVSLSLASFDYTQYSFRIEQIKSSFRILYSMLDQICFYVNDFWKLGLAEREADAFHICKSPNFPKTNKVLLSLYWVLCEFFEKYGDAKTASEKELAVLRNALEHKFVKIHEYEWNRDLILERDSFYHISENDLVNHTLRLLQLSREALMYLVYAINFEERKKDKREKSMPMQLTNFLDEWKV